MQKIYGSLNDEDSAILIDAFDALKQNETWVHSEVTLHAIGLNARALQLLLEQGFLKKTVKAGRANYVVLAKVLFPYLRDQYLVTEKTIALFWFSLDRFLALFRPSKEKEDCLELDEADAGYVFSEGCSVGVELLEFVTQYMLKSGLSFYDKDKQKHLMSTRGRVPTHVLRNPDKLLKHVVAEEMRAWKEALPEGAKPRFDESDLSRSHMFAKLIGVSPLSVQEMAAGLRDHWFYRVGDPHIAVRI